MGKVDIPREHLIDFLEEGYTYKQLASIYGVSESCIHHRIKSFGIYWMYKPVRYFLKENIEGIVKLLREGHTYKQIADQIGSTEVSIRDFVSKNKLHKERGKNV